MDFHEVKRIAWLVVEEMLGASTGSSLVSFQQSGSGAIARTVQDKERDIVSVCDWMTSAQIADVRARTASVDMAAAAQSAATALGVLNGGMLWYPAGDYKQAAAVALSTNTTVSGAGQAATRINAWGVDGFTVAAGKSGVNVERMSLFGYTAGGSVDAKTQNGIAFNGASGNLCASCHVSKVYARGWAKAVYASYVQAGGVSEMETLTCTYDVHIFGQTTNFYISDCTLVTTNGTASVFADNDSGTRPEGIVITNSLLYGGTNGILSDGVLFLIAQGNIIDGCADTALDLTNPAAGRITDNWIYATNYGVYLKALGGAADVFCRIAGNYMEVTAANAKNIRIGNNNQAVSVVDNDLYSALSGGTERLVFFDGNNSGSRCSDNYMAAASANPSVYCASAGVSIKDNQGDATVEYSTVNYGPVSSDRGNAGATLVARTDPEINLWETPINADRTATLSTTGATTGDTFTIIRTAAATGAFNLIAGGLKNLAAGQGCRVRYELTRGWFLEAFWSL